MSEEITTFEAALARNGSIAFTNVGVSMKPLIRQGRDVMRIEALGDRPVRKYDAVLFRRPGVQGRGEYVLHRVLKCRKDGRFWIVGDNCTEGEIVPRENILGVLTAVSRAGKLVRVTDFSYRMYLVFWCKPYHLRFLGLRIRRFFKRAIYRARGKKKERNS